MADSVKITAMEFKERTKKVFNIASLLLMGSLIPLTFSILVSANALPGDTTYPLKLSLENMAVFFSQAHPPTEMELRLVVLNRRYQEARDLLEREGSARGYKYFNEAATSTHRAVLGMRDENLQERYEEELAEDLRRYNAELEYLIRELETP